MKPRFRFAFPPRGSSAWLPALLVPVLAGIAVLQLALPNAVALPPGGSVAGVGGGRAIPDPARVLPPVSLIARSPFTPVAGGNSNGAASDPLGGAVIAGTVQVGRARVAMVMEPSGHIRQVPPGGSIGGWRLVGLTASGARLSRGGNQLEVAFGARATPPQNHDNSNQEEEQ